MERGALDQGSVGYYKVQISQSVIAELATTAHAGIYRYTFHNGNLQNNLLVDVGYALPSFRTGEAGGLHLLRRSLRSLKGLQTWDGTDRKTGQFTPVRRYRVT